MSAHDAERRANELAAALHELANLIGRTGAIAERVRADIGRLGYIPDDQIGRLLLIVRRGRDIAELATRCLEEMERRR